MSHLKSALQKRNRKIAALTKGESVDGEGDPDGGDNDDEGDDAGNAFGGKREKKKIKNSN